MRTLVVVAVILVVAAIVLSQSLFIVDVTQQALVLRFGDVKSTRVDPGIYLKAPFVDNVIRFERRLLRIDAPPVAMPDKEKQNLVIDSYARYRITDVFQFRKTLQTEANARSRLGDIVTSALRAQIALRDRNEIIGAEPVLDPDGIPVVDEKEGLPLIEGTESRTTLLEEVLEGVRLRIVAQEITESMVVPGPDRRSFNIQISSDILDADNADRDGDARSGISATDIKVTDGPDGGQVEGFDIVVTGFDVPSRTVNLGIQEGETVAAGSVFTVQYFVERDEPFGIGIIDVRIKRADFPDSVTPTIFTRMRAERNRIATKFRAEGDEQDLQIRAGANKDREIILAEAERTSNQVRGEGQAEAISILADALEEDPEFFAFLRSLEAYQQVLNTGTTVILSADADLFRYLDSPGQDGALGD
jgi:regulator of protease activity HflC (stomatin/prohibitin superfamily)